MAQITFPIRDVFPIGTSVSAYPMEGWTPALGGLPSASADTSVVAADGTITFEGLQSTGHVASAVVGGTRRYVMFTPTGPANLISEPWAVTADPGDPYGTLTLDNASRDSTPPRDRACINWMADGIWMGQTGFDVGGTSPTDDDFVLYYHRWPADTSKSRDVIYITNEEVPRVGIEQNFPVATLDVSAAAYSRMTARLSAPTPHSTLLDGAQNTNSATINVDSTTGFASSGVVFVSQYPVPYTGKTATQFTGCTGLFNTVVSDNATVVDATWLVRGDGQDGSVPVVGVTHDGRLTLGFASRFPLGLLELDSGTTSSKGIWFGGDTVVYRTSAGALKVDGVSPDPGDVEVTGQVSANQYTGRGLQKASVTTGSVNAGALVNVTLNWATAFSDTTYAVMPAVVETTDEKNLIVRKVLSRATGSCVVQVENGGASARTGTVLAVGMA